MITDRLASATFSPCGSYRYSLWRRLPEIIGGPLVWLMLNPSTADATRDDPTIRKVLGFTRRGGYGAALVVNLFAMRSTDPRIVRDRLAEAEGPDNRSAVLEAASQGPVVCAWGAQPWARSQAERVVGWLREAASPVRLLCLGRTKDGDPIHPLMPSYDAHPLVPFLPRAAAAPQETSTP